MKRIFTTLLAALALGMLSLPAMSAVKVIVVDRAGKPVPKAKVVAVTYINDKPQYKLFVTDKAGKFTAPISGDSIQFQTAANGYAFNSTYLSGTKGSSAKITLLPEKKLTGKVIDEKGRPIEGAIVRMDGFNLYNKQDIMSFGSMMYSINGKVVRDFYSESRTAKNGTFVLNHAPDIASYKFSTINIHATKPGRALIKKWITKESVRNNTITLPPACTLQGTLYQPGKTTTAPEGLFLTTQFTSGNYTGETRPIRIEKNGKFKLAQLPPGKISISLESSLTVRDADGNFTVQQLGWLLPAVTDLDLSPGMTRNIELVCVTGSTVKGTVIDEASGTPLSQASILISDRSRPEGSPILSLQTNEKGEFTTIVAPGEVNISVSDYMQGDNYVSFPTDARPTVSLKLSEGENKSDLVIKVSPGTKMEIQSAE